MKKRTLRVGTLFSGIGAFEEALRQLNIPHEIKFACDNGEIEMIPLSAADKREYKKLDKKKNLTEQEKDRYNYLKGMIDGKIEHLRQVAQNFESKDAIHRFVKRVYRMYGADKENMMKKSYLANYKKNIKEEDFYSDVRFLSGKFYKGDIDIMVGGSPCQSFSTYGKKRGLEDTRGTLFYDYARIIDEVKPKIFIYENVPGLLTDDGGETWKFMIEVWKSLKYDVRWSKLNSRNYNHPQNRVRLFLIGFRKDIYNKPYDFPPKMELKLKSKDFLEPSPVDDRYYLGRKGFEWVTNKSKNKNKTRYNRDIIGCQTANQQFNWIGDLRVEKPTPHHYENPNIYIGSLNGEDAVARKMTPRECLNLMGFSKDFKIVVEEKEAYRQSGNSIVVPVLKELIKSLEDYLC